MVVSFNRRNRGETRPLDDQIKKYQIIPQHALICTILMVLMIVIKVNVLRALTFVEIILLPLTRLLSL